ncbi:MAG: hypothetical protein AABN95_14585 [Acidobacteriota bacterium]
MGITRAQLATMKEDQLQKEVLIPLFASMGFNDVHLYQGSTELGKDVVMWKSGDLGERVNYAVVAKAKKITGKATGSSSAAEVRFQIEQAFGNPWLDPKTTEERRVERCFVVCSRQIKNEAITAIRGTLGNSNLDKLTRFINGDQLWQLIQKHLPERVVFENLKAIQNVLDAASPHHHIVAKTTGEMMIQPKTAEGSGEHPLLGAVKFSFPDTADGHKAREDFERHLATGAAVTITKPYLEDFVLPDVIAKFVELPKERMELTLGPSKLPKPVLARISIKSPDGDHAAFEYVQFNGVAGTEELSLENNEQPVPWKFAVVINMKTNFCRVSYSIKTSNLNVKQALEAYRFMLSLAVGGTLNIEHLDTGLILASMNVPENHFPSPDQWWLEVLEAVVLIQQKTHYPIDLPDEERLTGTLINTILSTASKLQTGKALYEGSELRVVAGLATARNIFAEFGEGKIGSLASQHENEQTATIFGVDIPLGPVTIFCEKVYLSPEDRVELQQALEGAKPDATFSIKFKIVKDCPIQAYYPNWLSSDEANAISLPKWLDGVNVD